MSDAFRGAPRRPASWSPSLRALLAMLVASLTAAPLAVLPAQEPDTPAADTEPVLDVASRVGRLSYLEGPVSFLAAEDSAWGVAVPNRPVSTGDQVWADADARAELDLGNAVLWLGAYTEVDVVRLGNRTFQIRVPQGTVIERVRVLGDVEFYEIDAPNASIALQTAGTYRVDVSADGLATTLTVWTGSAEVVAAGSSFDVHARQTVTIRGEGTLTYGLADAPAPDAFDRWSLDRDARWNGAASRRYVSAGIAGVEDLDADGRWVVDATYGPVWYPHVVAGWVPYRYGHWVWVGRWGWTWVDDAPWGWAPFHYGRWVYLRGAWAWCPGVVVVAPVYAPALVVFVGGSTWGPTAYFGVGGGIAWFPLGPDEVYWPPYVASISYIRLVNRPSVRRYARLQRRPSPAAIRYRNREMERGVTAIPWRRFTGAEPVPGIAVRVPGSVLAGAPVLGSRPPIIPTRESLVARRALPPGALRRAPALPPARLSKRPTAALRAPPPAPVPFRRQERSIAANAGRPLSREQVRALRGSEPPHAVPAPPLHPAAAPPTPQRRLTPSPGARPARPAPRPALPPRPPVVVKPPVQGPQPPPRPTGLEGAYDSARGALDQRQRHEYAQPPRGETPAQLSARQQAERRALEQRYERARATGAKTLPPPRKTAPAKKGKKP